MLHFNPQKMTISSKKTQTKATKLKTHVQLLSFIYTKLVVADVKGIPDFEEFIHVTTSRHIVLLEGFDLIPGSPCHT